MCEKQLLLLGHESGCAWNVLLLSASRLQMIACVHLPIFLVGKDFVHQLNMVCKVIGTPTAAEIAAVPSDKARAYLASMPDFPKGGGLMLGTHVAGPAGKREKSAGA